MGIIRNISRMPLIRLSLLLLLGLSIAMLSLRSNPGRRPGVQVAFAGPSVSQLEKIGELVATRVHITDVLSAEGDGFRGSWLIKGDAILSCDVANAHIVQVDPVRKTATIQLPEIRVTSARIDHDKTKTWSVEHNTWLPWKWGNQDAFRDAAMLHAQKLVESAAASERHAGPARDQAALLIQQMYQLVDWTITVQWQ
jgi:hypothetical protein